MIKKILKSWTLNDLLTFLLIGGIVWLIWFRPNNNQESPIDYEELKEIHLVNERRFLRFENTIKGLDHEIEKDSVIVYSASRDERDSLRAIYNPR